ncbi:LysE family transporter [Nisaea acidiphila]|uniref:LysE family transporter n=1 Tax=Nisaea acidiphila TaxID=1862145 RepID=A0A9J7AUY2_9PROT|nr:LysE family transporter [Nisaea acidiphila]UUX51563.1 LysE family transporter [Nisaea acidiphila]
MNEGSVMSDAYLSGMFLAYLASLLGMLSPGPNILAVIGTSMSTSRAAGKALALGIAAGSLAWGLLTLLGLTALIALYASALTAIKIAGALYLLVLAFKSFRSALSVTAAPAASLGESAGRWGYFRRGLLIQLTNPKAALTWIAIMSLAMGPGTPLWVGAVVVLAAFANSAIGHLAYAIAFSTEPAVRIYRRMRRWIDGALGCFFCFASYKILTSKS